MTDTLTPTQCERLLTLARATLQNAFAPTEVPSTSDAWLREPGAVFVTLRTARGDLRGCIGTMQPREALAEAVATYAKAAAFSDTRFNPVRDASELADLRLEVSVLGPLTPLLVSSEAEAVAKLRPNIDGVLLRRGHASGVFLPQVWEQLPDPHEFLAALRQKAGLPAHLWPSDLQLHVYQVQKMHEPGYKELPS